MPGNKSTPVFLLFPVEEQRMKISTAIAGDLKRLETVKGGMHANQQEEN
jgi:hypothetical protein